MGKPLSRLRATVLLWGILLLPSFSSADQGTDLPPDHPKVRTARGVFDALVRAVGDGRPAPFLRLRTGGKAAEFSPSAHAVYLAEHTYDLCVAEGPDSLHALAFLLAHELAHCYLNHGWGRDFGQRFADLDIGQRVADFRPLRTVELETQADEFGSFWSYVAGYRTREVAPRLLAAIYAAYGLGDDLVGYPALEERQAIVGRAADRVAERIPLFEAGHRLLLLQQYETAAYCFDYITRTFASRELLNNAGVARALQALNLFEPGAQPFAYPFELDAATRLRAAAKATAYGRSEMREEQRLRLLQTARSLFEQARQKDPEYAPAWVNLAAVALLQGEWKQALLWADQALQVATRTDEEVSRAHAHLVRGIARTHGPKVDSAGMRRDFETARSGAPALAALNLAALAGETAFPTPTGTPGDLPSSEPLERIAGLGAEDYRPLMQEGASVRLAPAGPTQPGLTLYARQTPTWESLVITTPFCDVVMLTTRPAYAGTTARGIHLGAEREQVEAAYGCPAYWVSSRQGTYSVYRRPEIGFRSGADGRIEEWFLYRIEE